jgi:endonuclease YncB( thermonuclease family)
VVSAAAIIFAALLPLAAVAAAEIGPLEAESDYVFDGDTFSAKVNMENGARISVRVRIRNMDAPELHGECDYETNLADKSKARLTQLMPKGTKVMLSKIKDDKYLGRIDALTALPDGRDAGDILVSEGLARPYSGGKRKSWCENKK